MRHTPIRNISEDENRDLYYILDNNPDIKYRVKIILLAGDGYTVSEIREMTNIYDKTIRKWIHRFNDYGVKGIITQMDYSRMTKIPDKARNEILRISSTSPREIGLKFSTWSLRSIAGYVKEKKEVDKRWHKPYYYTRYFIRIWCRMETFKDCSWQEQKP